MTVLKHRELDVVGRPAARLPEKTIAYIVGFALLIAGWSWWSASRDITVAPSPTEVLAAAGELIGNGQLLSHTWASTFRIATGFILATLVGVPLGMAMGTSWIARSALAPFVEFFRFLPSISLIVFAIMWFGIGEESKIFLVWFATVFVLIINTDAGVRSIPGDRIRGAWSLGARKRKTFISVVLPSIVPFALDGMRIGLTRSFVVIVAAEMLAADAGLGYLVFRSREISRADVMFVGIIALGVLGLVLDRTFSVAVRRLSARYV